MVLYQQIDGSLLVKIQTRAKIDYAFITKDYLKKTTKSNFFRIFDKTLMSKP
jgi:hypothetical protein